MSKTQWPPHPFFRSHATRLVIAGLLILIISITPVVGETGQKKPGLLTTTCENLEASPAKVASGSSGTILFTCPQGKAAFTVAKRGKALPAFNLPMSYTALTIVAHVPGETKCAPGLSLVPNKSVSFSKLNVKTSFDYCASFSDAPSSGLAAFNLDWQVLQGHQHGHEDHHEDD